MLWAYIADASVAVISSHLFAGRRYRLRTSKKEIRNLLGYGWPLILNGAVLFLAGQGDRSIIGSQIGIRDLANYAVAAMLTGGPTLLVIKVFSALFVPLLSGDDASGRAFARRYDWCGALTALSAFPILVLLTFYGKPLAEFLYGGKYSISEFVMAWLAVVAAARILRFWPQAAALATGRTQDVLIMNTLPVTGFLVALATLNFNYGASGVAMSVAAGEAIALVFALERSDRKAKESHSEGRKLGVLFFLLVASCMVAIRFLTPAWTNLRLLALTMVLLSLTVAWIILISGSMRSWLIKTSCMVKEGGTRRTQ
jgi:O-antigen/teichoic acid export membrane protein